MLPPVGDKTIHVEVGSAFSMFWSGLVRINGGLEIEYVVTCISRPAICQVLVLVSLARCRGWELGWAVAAWIVPKYCWLQCTGLINKLHGCTSCINSMLLVALLFGNLPGWREGYDHANYLDIGCMAGHPSVWKPCWCEIFMDLFWESENVTWYACLQL